jgi:hypothetical protein
MSLVYKTHIYEKPVRDAEPKHTEYRFFFALVCLALGLVVASVIFTPEAVRSGMNSGESWFVGP